MMVILVGHAFLFIWLPAGPHFPRLVPSFCVMTSFVVSHTSLVQCALWEFEFHLRAMGLDYKSIAERVRETPVLMKKSWQPGQVQRDYDSCKTKRPKITKVRTVGCK